MIITDIKKTKYGYNIFFDKEKINIEEMVFFKHRLKRGYELSNAFLETLLKENEIEFIKRKSLVYLGGKRSVLEFKTYLRKLNAAESLIENLTSIYKQRGYLNDLDYAKSAVLRLEIRYGKNRIRQELVKKGIHKEIIDEVLNAHTLTNTEAIVKKVCEATKAVNYIKAKEKALRSLISKGFNYEEVEPFIKRYLKKENFNETKSAKLQYEKLKTKYQHQFEGAMLKNKIRQGLYQRGYSKETIDLLLRSE